MTDLSFFFKKSQLDKTATTKDIRNAPHRATTAIVNRPYFVEGTTSPYPTLVKVMIVTKAALPNDLKSTWAGVKSYSK